jgi:HPt (histidine-containing phosphotransfer) domain-containing protein
MQTVLTKPIRRQVLLDVVDQWLARTAAGTDSVSSGATAAAPGKPAPLLDNDPVPLDLETAVYEFGDRQTVQTVVTELLASVAGQVTDIQRALPEADWARIRGIAHAIKGGAATVEARPLAAAAAALENHCRRESPDDVPLHVQRLETALQTLKQHVAAVPWLA